MDPTPLPLRGFDILYTLSPDVAVLCTRMNCSLLLTTLACVVDFGRTNNAKCLSFVFEAMELMWVFDVQGQATQEVRRIIGSATHGCSNVLKTRVVVTEFWTNFCKVVPPAWTEMKFVRLPSFHSLSELTQPRIDAAQKHPKGSPCENVCLVRFAQ
jgi:hypothetical protein